MKKSSKTLLFTASIFVVFPLFFFILFIFFTFGNITESTVVKTVTSPTETHYAQVISVDQGALGGNTIVKVFENEEIDLFFLTLKDKGERIYLGEFGEHENIKNLLEKR